MAGVVLGADDGVVSRWADRVHGDVTYRTLISGDRTSSPAMTTGLGELPPGGVFRTHRHTPAETYCVVAGEGSVTLDGVEQPVRAGDSVFIPGGAWHGLTTTSAHALRFSYVLAADSLRDVDDEFEEPGAA